MSAARLALGCAPPGFAPLFPDGGEFARSASTRAGLVARGALPREAALHLFAYELVERLLDALENDERRVASLLWPPCVLAALGIDGHAWPELAALLPRDLVHTWTAPADAAVEGERVRLGLPELPAGTYRDAVESAAREGHWTPRRVAPAGYAGEPERRTAAAFLVRGDRVLLERRPDDARVTPGVWDVPGGHPEDGEAEEQALARELLEELGIEVESARPLCTLDAREPPEGRRYRHALFLVERFRGEPRAREGQILVWWPLEEALRLADLNPPTGWALQELVERD